MSRTSTVLILACLAVGAGAALCRGPIPLTPAEGRQLHGWLRCIECNNAELDSVLAVAGRKEDSTVSFFRARLLLGPDSMALADLAQRLRDAWVRDSTDRRRRGLAALPYPVDTSIARSTVRYVRKIRVRSAVALGWTNTPPANAALDSARQVLLDPRVLRYVQYAIDSLPLATPP